jgi:hypothetical protein
MSTTTVPLPEERNVTKLLEELEIPFPPDQVLWRVTNTSNDKKRGQIVPYADQRAYTDRLNALLTPQGWTRDYKIETMNNITRMKKGESIVTGKVLVSCLVTILGVGSHSGTGEEWADDDNAMTSAEAQAFKRACSCFGLGRYFYDCAAEWVDLDQYRQPVKVPTLPAWMIPENWREGVRPVAKSGNGNPTPSAAKGAPHQKGNGVVHNSSGVSRNLNQAGPDNGGSAQNGISIGRSNGNGHNGNGSRNTSGNGSAQNDCATAADPNALDLQIIRMERVVGPLFYRNVLREFGKVNQPRLIRDVTVKQKVLQILESATRGFDRLGAVTRRLDRNTVDALLEKIQAPPLHQISDMKTLENVVYGLEELAGPRQPHAA